MQFARLSKPPLNLIHATTSPEICWRNTGKHPNLRQGESDGIRILIFRNAMGKATRFPSLDGWRAVSILLVLGYHCQFAVGFPKYLDPVIYWLFDGNLGVRFFFVLSGFLITHLLWHEHHQAGGLCLRKFYARRALRILP